MPIAKTSKAVGDSKSPPLKATESGLRAGADQANKLETDASRPSMHCRALSTLIATKIATPAEKATFNCRQIIWVSIFFDGTGNNLDADIGFLKQSNIAKLYGVCKEDNVSQGIYTLYIPGVGTYFAEIGDDGGSASGQVAGAMGEARINFALMAMDQKLRHHLELARAPVNAIEGINIAVFGFSRGAALARAFVNKLFETRCKFSKGRFFLVNGNWPVRVRFMGLFDTVSSVGQPMSMNTTDIVGAITSNLERLIRKRLQDYKKTRPQSLAFAERGLPGADPAPGSADGHEGYGASLAIDEAVEEVRHFVAAHEMRNSFPVDSISVLKKGRLIKPAHFHETVYPGVHSDVGGSYAPEEGGKSKAVERKFGLIPLAHMYHFAIRAGVPLLNPDAWEKINHTDFSADEILTATYDDYIKKVGAARTLGHAVNNHMQHYFAWRFRSIRLKKNGDKAQSTGIAAASSKFKQASVPIDASMIALQTKVDAANMHVSDLESQVREYERDGESDDNQADVKRLRGDLERARGAHEEARRNFLKENARKDALPDMTKLQSFVDLYDRQLMLDVEAILAVLKKSPRNRADLRPHYRLLVEAYEAEFVHHRGLVDKTIIAFFDDYIHDSLAGFGKDATLPSDPRVVYLGGDEKFAYASVEKEMGDEQVA